jgi:hypothetical protein
MVTCVLIAPCHRDEKSLSPASHPVVLWLLWSEFWQKHIDNLPSLAFWKHQSSIRSLRYIVSLLDVLP